MDRESAPRLYRFGDFELDAMRRTLVSRAEGTSIPLTAKVFDALLHFVEHPGQLVEKRHLLEVLWPNVVVEEGNLTQTIHTLRRALGERPSEHRYIVTVAGRGYRFVSPVEPVESAAMAASAAAAPRRRARWPWLLGAALALAVLAVGAWRQWPPSPAVPPAVDTTLAVLPFADLSEGGDQAWFADGLAEEVMNQLVQLPDLRVIARSSSFSFRDRNVDIQQVRERLGVTHVLEGSVRRSGERVRVTAQLIDATTSAHLWSANYDREMRDVLEVQDAIAQSIARALDMKLSPAKWAGTTDTAAHEQFLKGLFFYNRREAADIGRAREAFEEAVRMDPGYARAWSGIAATWPIEMQSRELGPDEIRRWREASVRALEAGPDLAEAHVRASDYLFWSGDIAQANQQFQRAIELQPGDPLVLARRASAAATEGHLDESLELMQALAAIDPASGLTRANLGVTLLATNRPAEAIVELRKARELGVDSPDQQNFLCKALLVEERDAEALAAIGSSPAGPLRDQCEALVHLARGERAQADLLLARMVASAAAEPGNWLVPLLIAELQARMGRADAAFATLQQAGESPSVAASPYWSWQFVNELQIASLLAPLHGDPRWGELLSARRATWERHHAGP